MQPTKIVSYLRVSTDKQGDSGIGLESQRRIIRNAFPNSDILAEIQEVESGFNNNRPMLGEAVSMCKREGATLVFSDIDRAGRDERFLFSILPNLGVPYLDASTPHEDPNTSILMQIKKVFANIEGRKIQNRSKAATETRRLRGDKLGNPDNFTQQALQKSALKRKCIAVSLPENVRALAVIQLMEGKSNKEIAEYLNEYGFRTKNNCLFTHVQVKRIKEMFLTPRVAI